MKNIIYLKKVHGFAKYSWNIDFYFASLDEGFVDKESYGGRTEAEAIGSLIMNNRDKFNLEKLVVLSEKKVKQVTKTEK